MWNLTFSLRKAMTQLGRPKTLYVVQLVTVLITFFITQESDAQPCRIKWFGENCMYRCMCSNDVQCDNNGYCPGNACANTYFGPGCQFRDRISTHAVFGQEVYFQDHDANTCNPDAAATVLNVTVIFDLLFTWFRIEVKDERAINKFDVLFDNSFVCQNERRFFGTKWVDVMCANQDSITNITIQGDIVADICSFYISGGRNVALRQNTSQSSVFATDGTGASSAAVDGVILGHSLDACLHTNNEDDPWFHIIYNRPQYILYMEVVNYFINQSRLQGFQLRVYDSNHTKFLYYAGAIGYDLDMYSIRGSLRWQANEVKIRGTYPDLNQRYLHFCEFLSYAETVCPGGTFGLWCEQQCPCLVTEACNPVTGMCAPGCNNGFYGLNCSLPCSRFCLGSTCTNAIGKCLLCIPGKEGVYCENDCQPGFYGLNCSMPCSVICVDGLCAPSDGKCFQCPAGFKGDYCSDACERGYYGIKCSMLCGKSCKGGICQYTDGKCVECFTGYEGDYCDKECQDGFFGDKCQSKCPKNCKDVCDNVAGNCTCIADFDGVNCSDCATWKYGENCSETCSITCSGQKCNNIAGECFSCEKGYTGKFCKGLIESTAEGLKDWWMVIVLASSLTVAICGTLLYCRKRGDQTSEER